MKGYERGLRRGKQLRQEIIKVRIPVVGLALTVSAAGAGLGFGNVTIPLGLDQGNICLLGLAAYLKFTTVSANITNVNFTGSYAIGSVADADGTLATTERNLAGDGLSGGAGATLSAATAKVSPQTWARTPEDGLRIIDNTAGSFAAKLNLVVTAADIADASSAPFTADGELNIAYTILGDS